MTRRLAVLALGVGFVVTAVGCDSSPRGPGSAVVTVEWEGEAAPLGAAKVFLGGEGLGQARGEEGAEAWSHTPPEEEGGMRVVVIHTGSPSVLRFSVEVPDLDRGTPQATLWRLVDQDNRLVPLDAPGYRVRVALVP